MMRKWFFIVLLGFTAAHIVSTHEARADINSLVKKVKKKKKKKESESDATSAPVCNAAKSAGYCYAFTGPKNLEKQSANGNQMACKLLKGEYSDSGACPDTSLLGRCTVSKGEAGEYTLHYYSGKSMDKEKAQKDCADDKSGLHAQGAGSWSD